MADPNGGYRIPGGGHEQGRNEVVGQFEDRLQFPSCGLRGSRRVAFQRIGGCPAQWRPAAQKVATLQLTGSECGVARPELRIAPAGSSINTRRLPMSYSLERIIGDVGQRKLVERD